MKLVSLTQKTVLAAASFMLLFVIAPVAHAQGVPSINIGCFQYGPLAPGCDLTSNPPSINTGGFHYGPQAPRLMAQPQVNAKPAKK